MSASVRAARMMTPKNLKDVSVGFENAKKGVHTLNESYAKKSSPFHRGANASRTTTTTPLGTVTSTTYQPAKLTKLGRRTVAGGVGTAAVGGYAYNKKVKKNMGTVSYWGVDHGEEIAKAGPKLDRNQKLRGKEKAGVALGGYVYGGVRARKGRKLATVGRMAGRTIAESTAGQVGGGLLGAAASRGNPLAAQAAGSVGSLAGGLHGSFKSYRNAKKRGDIKMPGQPGK